MRVLIVDDSQATRNYIKNAVKGLLNASTQEADSGFEAFRLLARDSFDVIVTDINMPDINGLELIQFVKKSKRHAETEILAITTQSTKKMQEKIKELGVEALLFKPFEPEVLAAAISSLLKADNAPGKDCEPA
jgi:two-component system, chemotaxis family, chemotaxis protein CheY